jgi:predicted nuclease with TOPRIM domain
VTPALIGLAAAIGAALLTYLGVVRRTSGKIATTEASQLWAESAAIRESFREENEVLRQRIDRLEAMVDQLNGDNRALRQLNSQLAERVRLLEAENARLHSENEDLRRRLDTMDASHE